jgi:hypothetical protein
MKKWMGIGILAILIAVGSIFLLTDSDLSTESHMRKLNSEFLTCLPDKLTPQQVDEVSGILSRFYEMSAQGKVEKSDQLLVKEDLFKYIQKGEIALDELNKFMAKVSFLTFKSNPNYNLPEGSVDHPLLVPEDD